MARRFYERVGVEPVAGGFAVLLDAKPLLSPGKRALTLPVEALARAVAAEWQSQGERIEPASMPLTRLANTALDTVTGRRGAVVEEIAGYAQTDLVCYRVARPEALRRRQAEAWDPLVLWMERVHGVGLAATAGLLPAVQPEAALVAVRDAVEGFGDFGLTALHAATGALGSVVIALAMAGGRISAQQAFEASLIEESFQIERWGEDAEAETRRARLREDLAAADRFLGLCR